MFVRHKLAVYLLSSDKIIVLYQKVINKKGEEVIRIIGIQLRL